MKGVVIFMKKHSLSVIVVIFTMFTLASCNSTASYNPVQDEMYSSQDRVYGGAVLGSEIYFWNIEGLVWFVADINERAAVESIPRSAIIVRAEVLDEKIEYMDSFNEGQYRPYPTNSVKVLEVFLGDVEVGEVIDFGQRQDRARPISIGDDLVLFLILDTETGRAGLANSWQAFYHVPPELTHYQTIAEVVHMRIFSDDMALESVNPHNSLVLTLGDLVNIAESNAPYSTPLPINIAD